MLINRFVKILTCGSAALMLSACVSVAQINSDPKEWSYNPAVEARKFYVSGQTVDAYILGKPAELHKETNIYFLCNGFIDAGDQMRADQCIDIYKRKAAAVPRQYGQLGKVYDQYLEYLAVQYNQFLLEQGRFKEVHDKLMPYMKQEAALLTFSQEKAKNFNLRVMAAPILAKAQRNLGGIDPLVKEALENDRASMGAVSFVFNPKGVVVMKADKEYLLGNYEACYQQIPRSAVGDKALDLGLFKLLSVPLDQMYEGSADAMARTNQLYYLRLQALCAYESGKHAEAKEAYLELLGLEDTKDLMGLQRLANDHLGRIEHKAGNKAAAVARWKAAITALEAERAAIDSEAGRMGYATNKSEIYALLIEELIAAGQDAEAFEYAERAKSRALVDMLGTRLQTPGQDKQSQGVFSQTLQKLQLEEGAAQAVGMGLKGGSRSVNLKQQIASGNPNLGSLISVSTLPVKEVQSHLKANETIIEYFGDGGRLYAFVVTKKGVKALRLDGKRALEQAVSFRQSIADPDNKNYQANGKKLFDMIMAPALPFASKGPLTIIPHGSLHYIPFAALHDGRSYLVNRGDLRVLPSASVLPFLGRGVRSKSGTLLVLGNPDLGDRTLDLPGAEEEAVQLSRLSKGAKLLVRKQASESALRKLGPQHREIHFAMHGKFNSENPLSSGLYMSADAENDGILTVGELYDLQLNVDLVVLSACETALGATSRGDDVVGLNRGFLFAGASSIVSSLWEVDDQATRDLMVGFYQTRSQYGKAAALRRAQLQVMGKYPHPYYWAAFQVSGVF